MKLKRLILSSFRNLEETDLVPGPRFNIIFGNNAQGKTNLLESIYLLGTMKSFRMARNAEMMRWGSCLGSVKGIVERDGVMREIDLTIEKSGKRARVDRKQVTKVADFFGSLNVVVFSPEDISMVRGMPESRRKYLDRAIFSGDLSYLHHHHHYFRTLKNRNILLKSGDPDGLDVWTEKLVETGEKLISCRLAYLRELQDLLKEFYTAISGGGAEAGIRYRPHLVETDSFLHDGRSAIFAAIEKSSAEERRTGSTAVGPHRDDVDFILAGKVLKHYASQGEQRSFVLALKMAEIEYIQRHHGDPPVLLLDDMTSELDRERNRNLMEFLTMKDMQVFITTTSTDNILLNETEDRRIFHVDSGRIIN